MFDGVHRGHQAILNRAKAEAKRLKCEPAVLTFVEHPSRVLRPDLAVRLLMPYTERRVAIRRCGIRRIFGIHFTARLAELSPKRFVREVLLRRWNLKGVVIGDNFRFGHRREGDVADLKRLLGPEGVAVFSVSKVRQGGRVVQSTAIRADLEAGRIAAATRLLGRPVMWIGRVRRGAGIGRRKLVRTVNLALRNELIPRFGVYAGRVRKSAATSAVRPAVMNIGVAPTVHSHRGVLLEAHILDGGEVTTRPGEEWRAEPIRFLRPERKFQSVEALRQQISADIRRSRAILRISR